MTSYLLYTLAQLGFQIDILQFGMNVTMDVIALSVALHESVANADGDVEEIDLSEPVNMEG